MQGRLVRSAAILLVFFGLWGSARYLFRTEPLVVGPAIAAQDPNYQLADADLVQKVMNYIKQQYVEPDRVDAVEMLRGGLDQLQRNLPEVLALFEGRQSVTMTIDQATRRFSLAGISGINDLNRIAKEILAFVDLHYHGKTDRRDIEYLVIDGMLNALDPHSALLTPKIYNEFKIGTKGNFGGIGIAIGSKDGQLTVIAPIEGTPAWRAGLKANDRIMQIGEESTINMSLTEAVEKLRGRVGTAVALTVERPGRPPFTVSLKRAIIQIDSVQSTLLSDAGKSIGYIKIKSFQENTDSDFVTHLQQLRAKAGGHLDGMILDLRNNPGGLLQQAVAIADHFLDNGVIVSTMGAHGRFLEQETAHKSTADVGDPLVVLVNEGSASAAEIVTGALQFHRRGLVMGMRTFGKGSVQTVYDLRDGSALKLTIAEYFPGGKLPIQSLGILPDVELLPVTVDKAAMNLVEDKHTSERDLEKHLKDGVTGDGKVAAHRVRYLMAAEGNMSEDETTRREYNRTVDTSDFAIQFATTVLAGANPTAAASFPTLDNVVTTVQADEAKKVATALQDLGIPWQPVAAAGKPQLQVTYQLLSKDGQLLKSAPVGEEIQLSLTARNIGTGSFAQLLGLTEADEPFLDGKEFVFGTIGPSGARSWTVPFKVPRHMASATLPITVTFQEANLNRPASFTAMVPVQGTARPQFAYSYRLGPPVGSKVKPAGLLPIGKSVPLVVEVKNIGVGPSTETVATIKNVSDGAVTSEQAVPYIEVGRAKLGKLAPGTVGKATFRIHLAPGFEPSTFKMDLGVSDGSLLESVSNQLEFTVGSGEIRPAAGPWYEAPKIQMAGLKLPIVTTGGRQRLEGAIQDDQRVKDLFIFVGDEKVYYQANAKESNTITLDTEIPLKVGNNLVTIAARDNNDLLSRYTLFILRTTDGNTVVKQ